MNEWLEAMRTWRFLLEQHGGRCNSEAREAVICIIRAKTGKADIESK